MRKAFVFSGSALLALFLVFSAVNPASALEAKVSGQINQMVMWADDGNRDNFFVTDNDSSSTRFRFTGEETFGSVKAGIQFEIEAQRNASNRVTIGTENDNAFGADNGGLEWNDRWLNAYLTTQFGKFELGKGDSAANNTAEVDLSGTAVVTYSDITASGGALQWRDSTGALLAGSPSIGSTRTNLDGPLSRNERFRYSTPTFAGLMLMGSVGNGGAWDASLWYTANIFGKVAAAVGYTKPQSFSTTFDYVIAGSVSWLMPFGLNITGALGKAYRPDDSVLDDVLNYYVKLGYLFGIHAISVEYGMTEDLAAIGDESSHWGAAYVINPWKPVELYLAYRFYMLDRDAGPDAEDIQVAMAGTRIKF